MWLFGCCIRDIAPNVFSAVPRKFLKRSVTEAFQEQRWPMDVEGGLSVIGLFEYFQLWNIIQDFLLTTTEDLHSWRFESSGFFSSRLAYRAFFNGSITFEPWRCIWKSWAPAKRKVFLWLAIRRHRIIWPNEICRIRVFARCVIKQKKPSSTY